MKKITRRSFLAVCGTVAAAAALTACGGSASSASTTASSVASAASSTAEKAAGTLSGNVATGGSTSMKNVIAALTEGFAEVEPGVTVSYDPTGSGAGITGATDRCRPRTSAAWGWTAGRCRPYKTNNYYAILMKGGMTHDPVLEKDR